MLDEYRQHVEERASQGIAPEPLNPEQTAALIELLKSMGLLSGSPDAGASVAVICPYIK